MDSTPEIPALERARDFVNRLFVLILDVSINEVDISAEEKKKIEEQIARVLDNPETLRLMELLEEAGKLRFVINVSPIADKLAAAGTDAGNAHDRGLDELCERIKSLGGHEAHTAVSAEIFVFSTETSRKKEA